MTYYVSYIAGKDVKVPRLLPLLRFMIKQWVTYERQVCAVSFNETNSNSCITEHDYYMEGVMDQPIYQKTSGVTIQRTAHHLQQCALHKRCTSRRFDATLRPQVMYKTVIPQKGSHSNATAVQNTQSKISAPVDL